ncbi:hypothetical protein ACX1C1_13585 [Paenibacillus sp. strain BS8-2]
MIMLGVCMALLLILAMIGMSLSESDMEDSNTFAAFLAVLFGIPSILLIKYGRKLGRRQAHADEETDGAHSTTAHSIHSTPNSERLDASSIERAKPTMPLRRVQPTTMASGNPKPRTIACKNCGASKTLLKGQEASCDYCGTIL